jgi:signal transduction histidine kinase
MRENGTVAGFYVLVTDISDRKRHEDELHRWKDELETRVEERTRDLVASQERLRALASQLTMTEQRERRKLASDLHDYLAQLLVLGRMKMNQVRREAALPAAMHALTKDVDDIFQQVLTYTRTLIAELSPPSLQGGDGLAEALRWLAERMQKDGLWVQVEAELSHKSLLLSEERALFLFQSVRELLFNVLKHARVDRAVVRLTVDEDGLRVAVEDQGQGLGRDVLLRAAEPGHRGLLSVRERMEAMGGRMELTSIPGDGTTVTLILPSMP